MACKKMALLSILFLLVAPSPVLAQFSFDSLLKQGEETLKSILLDEEKNAPGTTSKSDTRTSQEPAPKTKPSTGHKSYKELVFEAQDRLNRLGYDAGPVDGSYGPRTARAIADFQRANGLPADGQVTPGLIAALRQDQGGATAGHAPPPPPTAAVTVGPAPDYDTLQPPDYPALLRLVMANNADKFTKVEEIWPSYLALHVGPALLRNPGPAAGARPNPKCQKLQRNWNNEFERRRYVEEARAVVRQDLTQASSWPKTAAFVLSWDVWIEEYDEKQRSFPLRSGPTGRYGIPSVNSEIAIDAVANQMRQDQQGRQVRMEAGLCGLLLKLPSGHYTTWIPVKLVVENDLKALRLPFAPDAARAFLEQRLRKYTRFPQYARRLRLQAIIEVGPGILYHPLPARVIAARLVDSNDGNTVVHDFGTQPFQPETSSVIAGAGRPLDLARLRSGADGFAPIRFQTIGGVPVVGVEGTDDGRKALGTLIGRAAVGIDPEPYFRVDRRNRVSLAVQFLSEASQSTYRRSLTASGRRQWKGSNEFERERTRKDFLRDWRQRLVNAAPRLPFDILIAYRLTLPQYNGTRGGFVLRQRRNMDPGFDPLGRLHGNLPVVFQYQFDWPAFLRADPERAESLVRSLDRRTVYMLARTTVTRIAVGSEYGPIMAAVKVRSIKAFADKGFRQQIHEFKSIERAPDSYLLSGTPGPVRPRATPPLDQETLMLLFVKQYPTRFSKEQWATIARTRWSLESNLYADLATMGDRNVWAPFFPKGYVLARQGNVLPQDVARFREWSLKRASALPKRIVMRGPWYPEQFRRFLGDKKGMERYRKRVLEPFSREFLDQSQPQSDTIRTLKDQGIPNDRWFTTGYDSRKTGVRGLRNVALVTPVAGKFYRPGIDEQTLLRLSASNAPGHSETLLEVVNVEVVNGLGIVRVRPVSWRLIIGGKVAHETDFRSIEAEAKEQIAKAAEDSKRKAETDAAAKKAKKAEQERFELALSQERDECDASGTIVAKLSCYEALCASRKGRPGITSVDQTRCDNRILNLQRNVRSERTMGELNCREKYQTRQYNRWMPLEGTPAREAAMAACLKEPRRDVYGPDMVGFRLGMEEGEASANLARRLDADVSRGFRFVPLKETRPFEQAGLSWTEDGNRGIALFFIKNHGRNLVAGVSRRLYFGNNGPKAAQIAAGLRKKYGAEAWSDGGRAMLWSFPPGSRNASASSCSGLVDLMAPRDQWDGEWRARETPEDREHEFRAQQEIEQARSRNYEQCLMQAEVKARPFMGHGDQSGSAAYMDKFNKEMAVCERDYGYGASVSSSAEAEDKPRLPMMIGPEGGPGLYAEYKSCGPVVISLVNADADGAVKDASFALFDPAWIATQPAFAFKSDGATAKEAGGTKIDF